MFKIESFEKDSYKETMFSKKFEQHLVEEMDRVKEQLLSAKDFEEVLKLQTSFSTLKYIYKLVK